MRKIDRLGWAAGLAFDAYGVRLGVRLNDEALLPVLAEQLPPAWTLSADPVVERLFSYWAGRSVRRGVRAYDLVYDGAATLVRTLDRPEALETLERALRLFVAERSRRYVFVHAGVIEWEGRALLLPGPSRSGKSRLVQALLRLGARYYSDEYAVIDGHGRVHPYARPLALRTRGGPVLRPAEALGARTGSDPIPVGLVALCRYRRGGRWTPRPASPGRGLLAIVRSTPPVRGQPRRVLRVLRQVLARAPVVTGWRGEAREAAPRLLRRLAETTPAAPRPRGQGR